MNIPKNLPAVFARLMAGAALSGVISAQVQAQGMPPPLFQDEFRISVVDQTTGASSITVGFAESFTVDVMISDFVNGIRFEQAAFGMWHDGAFLPGSITVNKGVANWDPVGDIFSPTAVDGFSGASISPGTFATDGGVLSPLPPGFTHVATYGYVDLSGGTSIPPVAPGGGVRLLEQPLSVFGYTAPGDSLRIGIDPIGSAAAVQQPLSPSLGILSTAFGTFPPTDQSATPLFAFIQDFSVSVDDPPEANAGPDKNFFAPGMPPQVTLEGSGSDPNPFDQGWISDPNAYQWTWSGGAGSANGPTPTLSLLDIALATTTDTKILTLTVTDGFGHTGSDTMSLGYSNSDPTVTGAIGSEQADLSMAFGAAFGDIDLSIGIAGFEKVQVEFSLSDIFGSGFISGLFESPAPDTFNFDGMLTRSELLNIFGSTGTHTVYANIQDWAEAAASMRFDIFISDGDAVPAPEPTTTALLALGFLGAGYARRRRAH